MVLGKCFQPLFEHVELFRTVHLRDADPDAVLAASIFHFGEYMVPEAKAYFASRGIPVRPLAE